MTTLRMEFRAILQVVRPRSVARDPVWADRDPSFFGPQCATPPWFLAGRSVKWSEILLGLLPKNPTSESFRVKVSFVTSLGFTLHPSQSDTNFVPFSRSSGPKSSACWPSEGQKCDFHGQPRWNPTDLKNGPKFRISAILDSHLYSGHLSSWCSFPGVILLALIFCFLQNDSTLRSSSPLQHRSSIITVVFFSITADAIFAKK